uniref:Uncharacterized protein n=1 Tax=Fagus sylvatica TaxID=28930 RepID=A0A2N9ENQ2_FAGSY
MLSMESLSKMSEFGSKHVGRLLCSLDKAVAMTAMGAKGRGGDQHRNNGDSRSFLGLKRWRREGEERREEA